jgi:nicotinamide riboside transporter PnuC
MQKLLLTVALLSGLFVAYVDSRPTWDDAGITAVAIFLVSGLLTMLGYRRPWLLAIAVGVWIPLFEGGFTRNGASLLALVVAFLGAYAGWLLRTGFRKASSPA